MFLLIFMNMLFFLISMILLFLNFNLSKKKMKLRNKLTPFECGFDNISNLRLPFSIQFYMISIIFLIFDVEISLIFPIIKNFNLNFYMKYNEIFIYILIILIIGLYYEWKEGSLKWLNK